MNIKYSGKFEVLYCPKCKELTSQELIIINTIRAYLCTSCESVIVDDIEAIWKQAQEAYREHDDELDEATKEVLLDNYKEYLEKHRDDYINNPLFHYKAICRLGALRAGRKNWIHYGAHPNEIFK